MRQDTAHAAAVDDRAQDAVLNVVRGRRTNGKPRGNPRSERSRSHELGEPGPLLLGLIHHVTWKAGVSAAALEVGLGAKLGIIGIIFSRPIMGEQVRAGVSRIVGVRGIRSL